MIDDRTKAAWAKLMEDAQARLEQRKKEMEVPALPYQPTDNEVLIFRVPPPKTKERTEGGLVIPDGYYDPRTGEFVDMKDYMPLPMGLLVAVGCSALDWAMTHGILPGDRVCFGEYEGRERDFDDAKSDVAKSDKKLKKFLQMYHAGIRGSEDLIDRLYGEKPTMKIAPVWTDDGPVHLVHPIVENILGD